VAYPNFKKVTNFSFSYELVASGQRKQEKEQKIVPKVEK